MDEQRRTSSGWSWWIIGKEEEEGDGWKELIAKDQMMVVVRLVKPD